MAPAEICDDHIFLPVSFHFWVKSKTNEPGRALRTAGYFLSSAMSHFEHNKKSFSKPIDFPPEVCYTCIRTHHILPITNNLEVPMQLQQFADVRSGLVVTRKQAQKPEETACTYQLLNLKAVTDSGGIDRTALLPFHATEQLADHYFTHAGDIIVRISEPYTAVYITEETAG
ncbi:MAG: hypothetical protein J6S92_09815, partial [Oscillospiraceae bacterium]|nr:hypothetical protein [Oscillospiraceae bacterium]